MSSITDLFVKFIKQLPKDEYSTCQRALCGDDVILDKNTIQPLSDTALDHLKRIVESEILSRRGLFANDALCDFFSIQPHLENIPLVYTHLAPKVFYKTVQKFIDIYRHNKQHKLQQPLLTSIIRVMFRLIVVHYELLFTNDRLYDAVIKNLRDYERSDPDFWANSIVLNTKIAHPTQ